MPILRTVDERNKIKHFLQKNKYNHSNIDLQKKLKDQLGINITPKQICNYKYQLGITNKMKPDSFIKHKHYCKNCGKPFYIGNYKHYNGLGIFCCNYCKNTYRTKCMIERNNANVKNSEIISFIKKYNVLIKDYIRNLGAYGDIENIYGEMVYNIPSIIYYTKNKNISGNKLKGYIYKATKNCVLKNKERYKGIVFFENWDKLNVIGAVE